jgi:hypothetical protein
MITKTDDRAWLTRVATDRQKRGKIYTMTPTESTPTPKLKVTTSFFDSETMETVNVYKNVPAPVVTSVEDTLSQLKNDPENLLFVLRKGLEAVARASAKNDVSGWIDDETEKEYTGTPLDDKKVTLMINTFAKINGYNAQMSKDEKKAAKEKAKATIFAPGMREVVAANCKVTAEE